MKTLLLIFIQGTFLLNDHAVTLKHRFDDESTSSSFNHHNDNNSLSKSSRNNINELRMRDWDCYKVNRTYFSIFKIDLLFFFVFSVWCSEF